MSRTEPNSPSNTAEPRWLPADEIKKLNAADAEEAGHGAVIADMAALEQALQRPKSLWAYHGERDVVRLACALLVGIVEAHPFGRGNAPTALAALVMFLEANGYRWTAPDGRVLGAYVRALAEGRYTEEGLAETLRPDILPA